MALSLPSILLILRVHFDRIANLLDFLSPLHCSLWEARDGVDQAIQGASASYRQA
jgi:hypothetical protein